MTEVPDELFGALKRAESLLLSELSAAGVVRVEYAVGFVQPYAVGVWLGTRTDAERDAMERHQPHLDTVIDAICAAGAPPDLVGDVTTTAQSQETVDRDYDGSWFYALR